MDAALERLTDLAVELVRLGEIDPEEGLLVVVDVKPGLRQAAVDALGPFTEQRKRNDNGVMVWPAEARAEAERLSESGLSSAAIGRELRIPPTTIKVWLRGSAAAVARRTR